MTSKRHPGGKNHNASSSEENITKAKPDKNSEESNKAIFHWFSIPNCKSHDYDKSHYDNRREIEDCKSFCRLKLIIDDSVLCYILHTKTPCPPKQLPKNCKSLI